MNVVNLANIPSALIERIEVLAAGASAVYGSDAIAGVVNIILKDRFEGVDVNVRAGGTQQGGVTTSARRWSVAVPASAGMPCSASSSTCARRSMRASAISWTRWMMTPPARRRRRPRSRIAATPLPVATSIRAPMAATRRRTSMAAACSVPSTRAGLVLRQQRGRRQLLDGADREAQPQRLRPADLPRQRDHRPVRRSGRGQCTHHQQHPCAHRTSARNYFYNQTTGNLKAGTAALRPRKSVACRATPTASWKTRGHSTSARAARSATVAGTMRRCTAARVTRTAPAARCCWPVSTNTCLARSWACAMA